MLGNLFEAVLESLWRFLQVGELRPHGVDAGRAGQKAELRFRFVQVLV